MPNKETKKLRNNLSLHLNELKKEHTDQSLYKEGRNKEQSRNKNSKPHNKIGCLLNDYSKDLTYMYILNVFIL